MKGKDENLSQGNHLAVGGDPKDGLRTRGAKQVGTISKKP